MDAHVNDLVHRPGPHHEQKVDLINERMIPWVVEDHQENQGD